MKKLRFQTTMPVQSREKSVMLAELMAVIRLYQIRGIVIANIQADHEFLCLQQDILPIPLEAVA